MKLLLSTVAVVCVSLTLTADAQAQKPSSTMIAQLIIRFGLNRLGQPTADPGLSPTCANFVAVALHLARAKSTEDFGVTGMDTNLNYIWGIRVLQQTAGGSVSAFDQVQPGDVLQFRNVVSVVKTTRPDGSWSSQSWSFPQHTAIVYQNLGGGRLVLLQQNSNGRQFVTRDTIDLSNLTGGMLWAYRPVPK